MSNVAIKVACGGEFVIEYCLGKAEALVGREQARLDGIRIRLYRGMLNDESAGNRCAAFKGLARIGNRESLGIIAARLRPGRQAPSRAGRRRYQLLEEFRKAA